MDEWTEDDWYDIPENVWIEKEIQEEKEMWKSVPKEETWVDRNGDMIAINDWVDLYWKVKSDHNDNSIWLEKSYEAKIVDILPADGDWDDENNRPIAIPASVVVEYIEDGTIVVEEIPCRYDVYKNQNVCEDITIKEFDNA